MEQNPNKFDELHLQFHISVASVEKVYQERVWGISCWELDEINTTLE